MAYTKPQVVAQNAAAGSYAAGCPANLNNSASPSQCKRRCKFVKNANLGCLFFVLKYLVYKVCVTNKK